MTGRMRLPNNGTAQAISNTVVIVKLKYIIIITCLANDFNIEVIIKPIKFSIWQHKIVL